MGLLIKLMLYVKHFVHFRLYLVIIFAVKRETEEFRLLRDLFNDYDKEVRPVYNTTDVVNVEFSMSLIQIISVVRLLK